LLPALIVLFSFGSIPSAVKQYRMFVEAYERQQSGNLTAAMKGYATLLTRHPDTFLRHEALFDLAGAEYGLNHFPQASAIYSGLETVKGPIGANASYNRGNAIARAAFGAPKAPGYTDELRRSLACYRRALLASPGNNDARINYEIVFRALHSRTPPSPASGGGGGKGAPGQQPQQQKLSMDVSNLVLDNARHEEGQMMRRYFRPAPPRQTPKEQKDW